MTDIGKIESTFLLDLAEGKYNAETAAISKALGDLGLVVPFALIAQKAFLAFLWVNAATAPAHVVADGQGGWVPWNNPRVNPDGSLRPYDPAIDGPYHD